MTNHNSVLPCVLNFAVQAMSKRQYRTAARLYQLARVVSPAIFAEGAKPGLQLPTQLQSHCTALPPLVVWLWGAPSASQLLWLKQTNLVQQVVVYGLSQAEFSAVTANLPIAFAPTFLSVAAAMNNSPAAMCQHVVQQCGPEGLAIALIAHESEFEASFYQQLAAEIFTPGQSLQRFSANFAPLNGMPSTTEADQTPPSVPLPVLTLVLTVNQAVEISMTQLTDVLGWLRHHVQLTLVLTAASPSLLFGNAALMALLASGEIEQLQVTDQSQYFGADTLECIKKIAAKEVYLCPMMALVSNAFALLQYAHFPNKPTLHPARALAYLQPAQVHALEPAVIETLQSQFFSVVGEGESHAFVTQSAVARIGSLADFSALPLCFAAEPFRSIGQWWQLGAEAPQEASAHIPQVITLPNHRQLQFDLQPAAKATDRFFRHAAQPSVRRWLLTARQMAALPASTPNQPAYFIMTNFNKAHFLLDSVFSVLLQSHAKTRLIVMDDQSTDHSLATLASLQQWLPVHFLTLQRSQRQKGTYQLRNQAIAQLTADNAVYFVNDADDLSSARRAELQLGWLHAKACLYCFGDIVRTNSAGAVLRIDGDAERYGTASFAGLAAMHQDYGFFENLAKGADTEFIERLTRFAPKDSGFWGRYPLLFQSFDGNNLTRDIYSTASAGDLVQDMTARNPYMQLFRARHRKLLSSWLPARFSMNNTEFPANYCEALTDFFVPSGAKVIAEDCAALRIVTALQMQALGFNKAPANVDVTMANDKLVITSQLDPAQHAYVMVSPRFDKTEWQGDGHAAVGLYFNVEQTLAISACLIYQDHAGQQISHQFFWANQLIPVNMPADCQQVQLGFRLQGAGVASIDSLELLGLLSESQFAIT